MSDGADQGVSAGRALETIVGGAEQPTAEERLTRDQVRARIMAAPGPDGEGWAPGSYDVAADCIAKACLLLIESDPKAMLGKGTDLYREATKRWPGFDEKIGGATGFMVGWAVNCALWICERPPVPNPAIVSIDMGGD